MHQLFGQKLTNLWTFIYFLHSTQIKYVCVYTCFMGMEPIKTAIISIIMV